MRSVCNSAASTHTNVEFLRLIENDCKQAKAPATLHIIPAGPTSDIIEEQFISLPESPKGPSTVFSPSTVQHFTRTSTEEGGEASTSGQELPWNQASANIHSPLLRLHTGLLASLGLHACRLGDLLLYGAQSVLCCNMSAQMMVTENIQTRAVSHDRVATCWTHLVHVYSLGGLSRSFSCCYALLERHVTWIVCAEIVEFCRFLEPTAAEASMRESATQRVRQAIVEVYTTASVQVFGSFVTGIYPLHLMITLHGATC